MDAILIKEEIDKLTTGVTTMFNIQRLAMLLIVYNYLAESKTPILAHSLVETMPDVGDGEFEKAISGKEIYPLIDILSEHMAVIKTVYPKEYRALLDEIKELP